MYYNDITPYRYVSVIQNENSSLILIFYSAVFRQACKRITIDTVLSALTIVFYFYQKYFIIQLTVDQYFVLHKILLLVKVSVKTH